MVKKKAAGKKTGAKLGVRRDTVRDLEAKGKGAKVKGGNMIVPHPVHPNA